MIYSALFRKHKSPPLVDVLNSYEMPGLGQMLYIKLNQEENARALLKVIFLPDEEVEYKEKAAEINSEWDRALKLNESSNIIHCLGREYCRDTDKRKRCEILCQHFSETLESHLAKLSKVKILVLMTQVAQALAHAHSHNIFHGNLAPPCIMLSEERAVLRDFSFFRHLHSSTLISEKELRPNEESYFTPPELINKEFNETEHICETYKMKKQDAYTWAMNVLYFVGMKDLMKKLHLKKPDHKLYNEEVAQVKSLFVLKNRDIPQEGVSLENLGAVISACLKLNPLSRPSMDYVLKALTIMDSDVEEEMKTLCHSCGFHKHRLHQLSCCHTICKKCLYESDSQNNEEDEKARTCTEEIQRKECKVCGVSAELSHINLKCKCKDGKLAIVEEVKRQTEGKILAYEPELKKWKYPKCAEGHTIAIDDLYLLFGEENINKLKKERRTEAESIKVERILEKNQGAVAQ